MNTWARGVDTLVSPTQIKPNELSEGQDIQLVEDGKIQCPRDGQDYYGNTSGSKVTGIFPYYKSDGTKKLLRTSGTSLQVLNTSTNNWDTVSGYTYTTGLDTSGVVSYDRLYLENGTDPLTYYDGTSITSFTSINAPAAPTVTRTGTTGTYTYSYKITAVTATGETTGSTAGSTDLNQGTLDTTSYMTISWSAVTNAIGYNVYGRKSNAWYLITYLDGNGSVSYVDKGTISPNELFTPPEANSTAGPKGKYIDSYKDSLFIFGDPSNPSRLYYSGGGDKINDFSSVNGGGFIDISKNDGQLGTGLKPFKNSIIVFKEDSVYQFSFATTGSPQVSQVTAAIGCIAPRSIVAVENDIMFCSRRGVFSIGNEQGFSFDVLRTNELTARVRSIFQTIEPTRLKNIAAVYSTKSNVNVVVFSYTELGGTYNSKALIYDRERLGWYKWTNIQANCFTSYIDASGETKYLYGDDNSGYVKEILTGSEDFGSPIAGTFTLKGEDFGTIDQYKYLKDLSVVLRKPSGSVNLAIIKDGTETVFSSNINTISPSINFGHYTFKDFLFGESFGTGSVTTADEILLRTKRNLNLNGRVFTVKMNNGTSGASFTLLSSSMTAKPRSDRYRLSTDLL